MKKDVIIAVIIGFILGGSLALTATNLPNLLKKAKPSLVSDSATTSPSPSVSIKESEIKLEVEKPENESISEEKTITVSGKTKPGNIVFVETDTKGEGGEADKDGNFMEKITLNEGSNTIYIASYDEKGESATKTITVFYTEEKL